MRRAERLFQIIQVPRRSNSVFAVGSACVDAFPGDTHEMAEEITGRLRRPCSAPLNNRASFRASLHEDRPGRLGPDRGRHQEGGVVVFRRSRPTIALSISPQVISIGHSVA
jgi:hypothetical protein